MTSFGIIYALKGDTSTALLNFNKSISLDNKNHSAFYNRATILHATKIYSAALSEMNMIFLLGQTTAFNYTFRVTIKIALHKYNETLNDYDEAIKINPN